MLQVHELMIAHLCAYLGFPTVAGLGIKQATALETQPLPAEAGRL